jgi:hypothetical protein
MRSIAAIVLCLIAATSPASAKIEVGPDPFSLPHHVLQDWGPPVVDWSPPAVELLEGQAETREYDNWRINTDATMQVQNEEQVVVSPVDPNNVVAIWRDFRLGHREVGVGYSFDGGYTWTDYLIDGPAQYPLHSDPGLTVDRFGNFYAVILSYVNTNSSNGLFVKKSTDGGVTWGPPATVVDGVPGVFEDKELIACDRTGGAHDGNLYVAWSRFYDTQIWCARSTDGGASFQEEIRLSDSGGVQWPVPVVGASGELYIAWVKTSGSIRLDRSFDGGVSFGSDITVANTYSGSDYLNGGILSYAYPAMDCDITGGPNNGRLYVAYMDRNGSDYDMYLRRSDDQGQSWSSPLRLNDDAVNNGRDQFHPWLSIGQDGSVHVVFYDRRNDPGNYYMDLYYTKSTDGGLSWSPNERVTTVASDPNAGLRAGLIGEYIGLAAVDANRAVPVWTDMRDGSQDAYTTVLSSLTGLPGDVAVGSLRLAPASPNPFRGSTRLSFSAATEDGIGFEIFDVRGRRVRQFQARAGAGGGGDWIWDGKSATGEDLTSGLYLIRATSGGERAVTRAMLLR